VVKQQIKQPGDPGHNSFTVRKYLGVLSQVCKHERLTCVYSYARVVQPSVCLLLQPRLFAQALHWIARSYTAQQCLLRVGKVTPHQPFTSVWIAGH
jgi:hypothetical protein